ncbi:MAG: methylated-DNA--[protein]-cysteine S-methyltransferase [Tissierellia bacterium]|nr:methylated-DNA--[protein]-cysteine S-methyltransferase [Tissierellia bacterium]
MKSYFYYESPIETLTLTSEGENLIGLDFGKVQKEGKEEKTKVIQDAIDQLEEYFQGKRKHFDLPLKFYGTEFQKKCWNALITIPYGETRSYKDMSEIVNCPKGYRAVGLANNKNPIAIIAPCHRVIGSDGKLVGFGGGLDKKEFLLNLEKKNK